MSIMNLVGQRYGRLVVQELISYTTGKSPIWKCLCDCGKFSLSETGNLRAGRSTSCGCWRSEKAANACKVRKIHGCSCVTEYQVWIRMRQRCTQPNYPAYQYYGGRGIKVCDRWITSFANFLEDMGPKPSSDLSLDRIDNNGNYEPSNCRWATARQQTNNRRTTIRLTLNGVTKCIADWSEEYGIPIKRLRRRIKMGWSAEEALLTPKLK